MTNVELKSKEIILNKVRIVFPSLFEKEDNKKFPKPEAERKYAARFLLSKTDPVHAKTIEEINKRNAERASFESSQNDDDDDNVKIKIFDNDIMIDNLDIHNIQEQKMELPELLADNLEIEILD